MLADGRHLSLIDLDGLRRGPALLELGSWWADGIYRAVLEGDAPLRDAPAWQGLLAGYAQGGGTPPASAALAWSAAWNLLTQRAWRCVVNLKPGRFAIAPRLVALAAELADACVAGGRMNDSRRSASTPASTRSPCATCCRPGCPAATPSRRCASARCAAAPRGTATRTR